jgi:LysR family transcriptional regulator, regulator of abg operon
MDIRDLLDVRAICEAGSLRKAAEILGVTQPTLSNRVARLEDQLGAALFDRSGGRSRPTDLARLIAARAEVLANAAQSLTRDAKRLAAGKAGRVRIGIGETVRRILMSDVVEPIEDTQGDLRLEIITGHTVQLTEGLLRQDLDFAVAAPMQHGRAEIASELLLDATIVVVAHPDHAFCKSPPPDIRGLFAYPFATSVLEQYYQDQLRAHGIDYGGVDLGLVSTDIGLILRAVARRPRLFAAGPRILFEAELAAGQLRIVDIEVPFRHLVYLHSSRDAYPLPAVTLIQDSIRRIFDRVRAIEAAAAAPSSGRGVTGSS